jgi:hypothetical protein
LTTHYLRVKLNATTGGGLSLVPTPKSRRSPGHEVGEAGGDLSSDSSESHTDVAIRDGQRGAPGLVDSSGCLHASSGRRIWRSSRRSQSRAVDTAGLVFVALVNRGVNGA